MSFTAPDHSSTAYHDSHDKDDVAHQKGLVKASSKWAKGAKREEGKASDPEAALQRIQTMRIRAIAL